MRREGGQGRNPELDDPVKRSKIQTLLVNIHELLSNGKVLKDRYGVEASIHPSQPLIDGGQGQHSQPFPTNSALKRVMLPWKRQLQRTTQPEMGMIKKLRWAIVDRDKFEDLIEKLHYFVNRLYTVLPFPEIERNAVAIKDMRILSGQLERLRVFKVATLHRYPARSGAASVMLEAASQVGPGTISQWMENIGERSEGVCAASLWMSRRNQSKVCKLSLQE